MRPTGAGSKPGLDARPRRVVDRHVQQPGARGPSRSHAAAPAAEAAAALERAELGRNTAGHATIAPPSPLYAVPATEPVAKDRRIEDERIKHEAAAPPRGHHARPPTAISAGDDLADAARAIVENRAEDFARALSHLTSLVDARDEAGDTLLHLAASLDLDGKELFRFMDNGSLYTLMGAAIFFLFDFIFIN